MIPTTTLVLEPGRAERHYWIDLWRYRELFYILVWRDIAVRYKQTVLGILWAVIPPLATMAIMTVVFGKVAGMPAPAGVPYPILVFAALLPWQLFASAHLISKIYFPRLLIPAAAIGVALVDFAISLGLLAALMALFHFLPPWQILTLPLWLLLAILAALGPGLLLTALNVTYRDFRFLLPFIVQFGLYLSPVGFSSTVVREKFGDSLYWLYAANPMVGVIEAFRWALLGSTPFPAVELALSAAITALFLLLGITLFRRTERTFADVI
jgi:lipopolysaccharide transport system permease protein